MNTVRGGFKRESKPFQIGWAKALFALTLCGVSIAPARADSFTPVGSMNVARSYHMATLLQNSQVLVVGNDTSAELYNPATGKWTLTGPKNYEGGDGTAALLPNGFVMLTGGGMGDLAPGNQTELYNPVSGTWQLGPWMPAAKEAHTATRLLNGKILLAGGHDSNGLTLVCELYDPTTATWAFTGSLHGLRVGHTATLLQDGRVLVAGGYPPIPTNYFGVVLGTNTAEIYDPNTGVWTQTGSMAYIRGEFSSLLLPNGKAFVVGGSTNFAAPAELFDPGSGSWSSTPPMNIPRQLPAATLLPNGTVLVTGGVNDTSFVTNAEIYDPVANSWTVAASFGAARIDHTATLLASGQVLIAGGDFGDSYSTAELYDAGINPSTGTWTNSGTMSNERAGHTLTLLPNGNVLAAGGDEGTIFATTDLATADLYDSTGGTWTPANPLPSPRTGHTANLLASGEVLVAGGINRNGGTTIYNSALLFRSVSGTWTNTGAMNQLRSFHRSTLLSNGKVLVAGGTSYDGTNFFSLTNAEVYNPASKTWSMTGSMTSLRINFSLTLLPNGKVLAAGGAGASVELYDPATGMWTTTGSLNSARAGHAAVLLPSGKVLVAGGQNGTNLSSAELYNPATGTWIMTGSMSTPRYGPSAKVLLNGKVLITGGTAVGVVTASAEVYDPATGIWSPTGAMNTAAYVPGLILLPNGKLLMAGGTDSNSTSIASAELYDVGLGFSNIWQAQITSVTSPLAVGGSLTVNGNGFSQIIGNPAGPNGQGTATDYPLVQLRSVESGQTTFLLATNWSTNSFTSLPVTNFPPGYALATVFASGIPSTSSMVNIGVPVPTPPVLANIGLGTNGGFQFRFTNSPGALFGVWASANVGTPLTNWTALGAVTEVSPGQFQFSDASAANGGEKFYSVRAP